MKHLKRILSVILVVSLFVGSFLGTYALSNHGTFNFDTKDLVRFEEEEGTYYLQKVDSHIIFRIDLDLSDANTGYSLTDSSGNAINAEIEKISGNSFNILPPKSGYLAGETYTLILSENAHFHHEDLKNARKLVFCIEREKQESYKFADSVIQFNGEITEIESDKIKLSTAGLKTGNIVLGKNAQNEDIAYKINEILDDNTAVVSTPALDEIFSELEVYGEYEWNADQLVTNPDLEIEIEENVRSSNFFKALMIKAYADEPPKDGTIDVKITDFKTNSVGVEVKITIKPGKNGLFGKKKLRNQEVVLTLRAKISGKTKANIQDIVNWDVSDSLTSEFSWNLDITLYTTPETEKWKNDKVLSGLFFAEYEADNFLDYQKTIDEITKQLNEITVDETTGEIKLFDWNLPVPAVPTLVFNAQVKLFAEFKMAAEINVGQELQTTYTVGLCFTGLKFNPYSNIYRSDGDIEFSLKGKAEVKSGIKVVFAFSVINKKIVDISIDPQIGLYSELYVTVPILNKAEFSSEKLLYCYFEPGVYFGANFKANLNIILGKYEFSYELIEKKFPIKKFTLGNEKIAIGINANATSVRAVDNKAILPDILFEYFDVKKGINCTEKISYDDLKFYTNDGTKLEVQNGNIVLPATTSSSNLYVTAAYLHSDGRTYSTIFRVVLSGSMLEGKVSAYNSDLSAGELSGATVQLFSSNGGTPISSLKTDENGKFSFNVSKGNYRLVISADGYRTLTSNQSVAKDEIKYTEHILLMDNGQSGVGSAGGKVSNALNGKGLGNAKLKLRTDWNNTTGEYIDGFEIRTDSSGRYTISNIPVGYYTVEASLDGYVTGYSNIIVLSDGAKNDFDFTITPILSDDEIRIVLTWGSTPSDLDSHLIGKTPSNSSFNVYYGDKIYNFNGTEMANLDVDDTTSYGPETITILKNIHGIYTYAVHDFSNRGSSGSTALSFSNAVVRVFTGSTQVAEYHVPTDQVGTYWTVFQIDESGNILPINAVSNSKPVAQ